MEKERTSIGLVTLVVGAAVFFASWNGWNSLEIVGLGKQTAAVLQWQANTDTNLQKYQDSSGQQLSKVSDDVEQLKIDSATTKEIVKLIGERYQINSSAVEQRVIETNQISSSTAINQ